ncbi:hypothetical protein WKR88_26165 [Trinickia caryophylli]|uniref:Uncharacterized protein n=1 Tax=Trinickia caryophylli TaxID=28094 RepID=A0A1X7GB94_TRICW|nr:hypothetical protein [Trinickia caryophylli]PMS11374.1 hypothetical protein C0Z17_14615 [Trinickia caryophylli]TRX17568.1 hypothetical protein FNF07_04535 [Trinickia caryophylli]WQE11682.1 hypothetical protein U0034_18375 [Trinickia caryophylli]SMF66411.1 hypothetical protein SAMN06295900_114115 [Trinickia caryophylli]GLU34868.1 hypothetical protein Busp01_47100 [Trinickia caryophylli]
MSIQQTEPGRKMHGFDLVDADLDHLERAIGEPENRTLTREYWRRRVLDICRRFELTHEQRLRVDILLARLAHRQGSPEPGER